MGLTSTAEDCCLLERILEAEPLLEQGPSAYLVPLDMKVALQSFA